jgi:2-C-methyl-D-erythritol 2,4-cyclodiphosphate synthase
MRIGIGYDLHQLIPGGPLLLGGVSIPHTKELSGHSDGDAVAHAITDAILGALALGNIGQLFPDTDPKYKNIDSLILLAEAYKRALDMGYEIGNIDTNIIAQQPKLNPYVDAMRSTLSTTLGISENLISVKAKTNEHVGPEGREEAISVHAVALLNRTNA